MDYLALITAIFSATGFWKLVEFLFKLITNKRKTIAEIRNLNSQAESNIIENWILWSQTLEKRVKELETVAEENKELREQVNSQRKRIVELENKVERVEIENAELLDRLHALSKTQP